MHSQVFSGKRRLYIEAHKILSKQKLRKGEEKKTIKELANSDREREDLLAKCAAATYALDVE
jgi:hypothetical protein